jgi:cobalt-zinc-cadmium efflux system membrane fusion protein
MKAHMTRTESLLLLSLLVAPLTACKSTPPPAVGNQPTNVGIETTTAHIQQSTDYLEVPARISADPSQVVRVFPPLSGRILGLRVLPGQEVKKGDVIAQLQSSDIAAARADFEKAKIEVLRADRALTRGKLLLQHEVLSQADYYELEATAQTAHSELERTRQRIHELGFAEDGVSDEVALRAPISGVVLDIGTATGEMQRSLDNATTIATIANIDTVWIVGDVFERDLASVRPGREVEIRVPAYPDLHLSGRIANVGDALDPNTHTLKLRVVLPNPKHLLKADMFATIRVPGALRNAVILPATAVLHEGEKTFVFVPNASGGFEQRAVTTGRSFDSGGVKSIEVLTGLNDGDKVVTSGGALLRPASGE